MVVLRLFLSQKKELRMKRILEAVLFTFVLFLCASARADGNLNTSYFDGNRSFGYNTFDIEGQVGLSSYFNTKVGNITDVGLNYGIGQQLNTVNVSAYIQSRAGLSPNTTLNANQSMNLTMNGKNYFESVSSSFYDANSGGGKGVVIAGVINQTALTPEWWASGEAYISLPDSGLSSISATGYYSEYSEPGGNIVDNFWNSQWSLTFSSPAATTEFENGLALVGATSVPEPASLGLLTIGALGLLSRRSRR
jgi:hypothetical protein